MSIVRRLSAANEVPATGVVYLSAMTALGVLVGLLVALTLGLAALAQASPPDETWLAGFYDDSDSDTAVLSITSAVGALESHIVSDVGPIRTADERPIELDESAPSAAVLSPSFSRAPPAA